MLVHCHDFRGVHDFHVRRERAGNAAERVRIANQEEVILRVRPGVVEGAGDDLCRPVVTAHGIDRDRDTSGARRRGLPRALADRIDHGQEADSFGDCLSSIACRPLYQPQFGQT
jgi:hypothetical protein